MAYPKVNRPKIVQTSGAADAFLPLKNLAFIPPPATLDAGPLGSFE
jgi:hypothetical protein